MNSLRCSVKLRSAGLSYGSIRTAASAAAGSGVHSKEPTVEVKKGIGRCLVPNDGKGGMDTKTLNAARESNAKVVVRDTVQGHPNSEGASKGVIAALLKELISTKNEEISAKMATITAQKSEIRRLKSMLETEQLRVALLQNTLSFQFFVEFFEKSHIVMAAHDQQQDILDRPAKWRDYTKENKAAAAILGGYKLSDDDFISAVTALRQKFDLIRGSPSGLPGDDELAAESFSLYVPWQSLTRGQLASMRALIRFAGWNISICDDDLGHC